MSQDYIPLATLTLASATSTVSFSNIPATPYRDLILVCNFQNSGTGSASRLRINGDTGANYSGVWMGAWNTSNLASSSESGQTGARVFGFANGPVASFTNIATLAFMDYSATDKHKTVLSRYGTGSGTGDLMATASRYASNSALTSLTIFDVLGQTYTVGSRFDLYGIVG